MNKNEDSIIKELLNNYRHIAIIGLSNKIERASYKVANYLLKQKFIIYPVHPNISLWDGQKVYKTLSQIDHPIEIVNIFRNSNAILALVDQILAIKPKVVWLQLGIKNEEARSVFESSGITVIEDRCIKIEHQKINS
ncbi:MAG: CoA-binding protein [Nitrospinota bacterium]